MADWTSWRFPPFDPVTAICVTGGRILLGGGTGIARQFGHSWEPAELQGCVALVASIAALDDGATLLAGTIGDGVFRSTDAGRHWVPSNFGLTGREVASIVAMGERTVLAGTSRGVFWSSNLGKAWRPCSGTDGLAVSAMSQTEGGDVVAALESGQLLRSSESGRTWTKEDGPTVGATALVRLDGALVMGTTDTGIWRQDGNAAWRNVATDGHVRTTFTIAVVDDQLLASTPDGLAVSGDGGSMWRPLGHVE